MKECKNERTTTKEAGPMYECLQNNLDLTPVEKQTLMKYSEERVLKALEYLETATVTTTPIQLLHWHCQAKESLAPPVVKPEIALAKAYNQFLIDNGLEELAIKNQTLILEGYLGVILGGSATTISLKNSIKEIENDLEQSKKEILKRKIN